MFDIVSGSLFPLFAAADSAHLTVREWDWPTSVAGGLLLFGGTLAILAWTINLMVALV